MPAAASRQPVAFGPFEFDPASGLLHRGEEEIPLPMRVAKVLEICLERPGELLAKEDLLSEVWADAFVGEDSLTQAISMIRNALGDDPHNPTYIQTIPKRGYRFIAEVTGGIVSEATPVPAATPETGVSSDVLPGEAPRARARAGRGRRYVLAVVAAVAIAALVLVLNLGGARDALLGTTPDAELPPIHSLVVLPFDNLSNDPAQEYIADGLTRELIAALGALPALDKVIAPRSVMQLKEDRRSLPEIARALEVEAVVDSAVLIEGGQARVTAQLFHGETERPLWSFREEAEAADVFALFEKLTMEMSGQIAATLGQSGGAGTARPDPVTPRSPDPEAYDAYLKGQYHLASRGEEGAAAAVGYLEEAIGIDPGFAAAHAALAEAFWTPGGRDLDPTGERGRQAALRAVELDDTLAEAHVALAMMKMNEWDWHGSEFEFQRAIDLNPNSLMAREYYSQLLRETMRLDESLREIRRAEELDPLSVLVKTMVGWPLLNQHRYDEALAQFDKVLEMDPNFGLAIYNKGLVYIMRGMGEEVIATAREASSPGTGMGKGQLNIRWLYAAGHAILGQREEAVEILAELERDFGARATGHIASVHLIMGDEELALDWLERGLEQREQDLPNITSEPFFDELRDHPRFKAIRAGMGLM